MIRFLSRTLVGLASAAVLAQRGAAIPQKLTFAPYEASGIYYVGETVDWTVTAGSTPPAYAYKWTIRRNNAVALAEGALDLSNGRDTIEIVATEPGMIYVAVEAVAARRLDARALRTVGHETARRQPL